MTFQISKMYWFIILLVLTSSLWGWTGTLVGTVNNAAGAAIPGAAVTVTPVGGGASQRVLSGPDGKFTITGLPPGMYTVDVEYSGYKRTSMQNVELPAACACTVNVKVELQPGNIRETVEVQGRAVLINTENGQQSLGIAERTIQQTPVLDRNTEALVDLAPGVTPPQIVPSFVIDPQRSRIWETNGLPYLTNRRLMDGVENTEPFNFLAVQVPPQFSVQQMNVITSNYDAQFGRAAGTINNQVIRRGSNNWHGEGYEFYTGNALDARNFFNPGGITPQARSVFNQAGVAFGGPIKRDSWFFFGNFEAGINRSQTATATTVPTAAFRAGDFSAVPGLTLFNPATGDANGVGRTAFPNNVIPTTSLNPVAQNILGFIPQPNTPGIENNLLVNVPFRNDGYRAVARIDHRFGDTTNGYARLTYSNFTTAQSSPLGVLGGTDSHLQSYNALLGMTHTFSPTLIMELRGGYERYAQKFNNSFNGVTASTLGFTDPSATLLASLGLSTSAVPSTQISGMLPFGSAAAFPQFSTDNMVNIVNNWNWLKGKNNFRFGVDWLGINPNGFQNFQFGPQSGFIFNPGPTASPTGNGIGPNGEFANSFAAFLLGTPSNSGRTVQLSNPSFGTWQLSAWLADTFKVTSKFTIDLGVRWDVFNPLEPKHANGNFIYDPATNNLLPVNRGGVNSIGNLPVNWANLSPRIGLAYRIGEDTVVRGGYGWNYFNGPLSFWAAAFNAFPGTTNGSLLGSFTTAGAFSTLPTASITGGSITPIPAPNTTLFFTPNTFSTPYVQNYDLLVEHQLGRHGLVAAIGFTGNLGRNLPFSREFNAAPAGTGVAGEPLNILFGRTASTVENTTGLTSNYNSLQASLTKRWGQGLSFTAAYTYSRAIDHGGWNTPLYIPSFTGGPLFGPGFSQGLPPLLNNLTPAAQSGPATWDRTNMITVSHLWQLPIGSDSHFMNQGIIGHILGPWQLNGLFRFAQGNPFSVFADPTICNCPGNVPTAALSLTGSGQSALIGPLTAPYSNLTSRFGQPTADTLGILGRNSLRGPNITNYDFSLFRSFVLHEQTRLEFRGEVYNLSNSAQFANPIGNVNSSSFGQSTSTLPYAPNRTLQVAGRIIF